MQLKQRLDRLEQASNDDGRVHVVSVPDSGCEEAALKAYDAAHGPRSNSSLTVIIRKPWYPIVPIVPNVPVPQYPFSPLSPAHCSVSSTAGLTL